MPFSPLCGSLRFFFFSFFFSARKVCQLHSQLVNLSTLNIFVCMRKIYMHQFQAVNDNHLAVNLTYVLVL